ncbi:MAG: hypothetical protein H0U24_04290 [Thermoleophilaceae bacterium]|nr:hypothetical protein [Thermoleophilaceae bacterium]
MNRILRRKPSPAMAIALIALFVALGGSAYALTITGRDVKNGSLTGADIRRDSLSGRQIKESKVGKVPKAKVADRLGGRSVSQVTTRAFFAAQKAAKGFTGAETLIGKITLPAGAYIVSAKVTASNSATGTLKAVCFLRAGTSEDRATVALAPGGNAANTGSLALLQAHVQNSPFDASVLCKAEGSAGLNLFSQPPFTTATNTKIAAVRADEAQILDF